jgi:hypothetical protein
VEEGKEVAVEATGQCVWSVRRGVEIFSEIGNRKSEIGNLIVECCVSFLFNFTTSALTTIILPATAANSTL